MVESLENRRLLSTVLFNADFENGSGGASNDTFVLDASPTNLWHTSTVRSGSPTHAMYYGIDATRSYDTGATNAGAITSGSIDLAGQTAATLRFRYFLSAEQLFFGEPYETIKLEVLSNAPGDVWTELASTANTLANDGLWHNWTAALNSFYLGKTVQFRFTFDTTDEKNNGNEGWFLDDINVYGGADLPPTVDSVTPTDDIPITTTSQAIQYTFSENVSGVDVSDLVLSGSAAGAASVSSVTMGANASIWTFNVIGLTNGLLNVTLAPDAGDIVDSASQSLTSVSSRFGVYLPDIYENNNNFAGASNLGVIGGSRDLTNLSLHTGTDADFFQFTPDASGNVTITANYHVNLPASYTIQAFNGSQVEVTDTNAADDIITFSATAGQTYYIKVYSELQDPLHSYDININAPSAAPRILGVYVKGSGWSTNYLNFLGANIANSSATYGYFIPTGANQTQPLPWSNINQISVKFDEDVVASQSLISFVGSLGTYTASGYAFNATDNVATWTLSASMPRDRMYFTLPGTGGTVITDTAGIALDGEWTNNVSTYPSGNGVAGGNFTFRMDVLPGDTSGSGTVNITDVNQTKSRSGSAVSTTNYRSDVNGNNAINITDVNFVKSRSGQSLPPAPTLPSSIFANELLLSSSGNLLS